VVDRIGRYVVRRPLGQGGMGIVYAAHDPQLDRPVAIKTLSEQSVDPSARRRLWREARAAAKVNHPNVCQLYEVGEENDLLFLVMELLDGETLRDRIARGPCDVDEAVPIALGILAALEALHGHGVIHRDLKPANVFLTPLGVKLLDFGLARPLAISETVAETAITQAGTVVGTPRYMAPEVWRGEEAGPATDLFAVGALLYEMLTARAAFGGDVLLEIYESILTQEPPPIGGSVAADRIDHVIHRALRKKSAERFQTAAAMADGLREARTASEPGERVAARRVIRLMGLPLKVLRPDPETDFLAFSLPDAITSSLAGFSSLVVRSSATAAHFATDVLDLERIATQAAVDVVLSGTLMRSGNQLRVSAQLLEAPAGTVVWSEVFQAPMQDLFEMQDALTQRIVESLALPLSTREREALRHDVPGSARAYEFYLRANQLAYDAKHWDLARDLYRKCLDLDPDFAPAWARLGRVYRAISIYEERGNQENHALAQASFQRALELHPDLSIAHNLSTYLDVELGRAQEAMLRLLHRARNRMHDPELFAGLVQACRYCGLLDESIAAYEHARRLDPGIRTSVAHAYLMRGDYERAIETTLDDPPFETFLALELMGRLDEAISKLRAYEAASLPHLLHDLISGTRLLLDGQIEESARIGDRLLSAWRSRDPCGAYYMARHLARLGDAPTALAWLERSVEGGFYTPSFLGRDPWLDSLRSDPAFRRIVRRASERHAGARQAFVAAGGCSILGLES
jgi:non-specific serine/threonine protein kinase